MHRVIFGAVFLCGMSGAAWPDEKADQAYATGQFTGDAISAALELPWTTSPVEGQISRLKMLKRTMYGRAGFDLLRARVLDAA